MPFAFKLTIVVSNNPTKLSSTQSNYAQWVDVTHPCLKTVAEGGAVTSTFDAFDVVPFADIDLTSQLDFEMERDTGIGYDGTTGRWRGWVKIPSLSRNFTFFLGVGNPAITTVQGDPKQTWDTGFKLVSHFSDVNPIGVGKDSSQNEGHGTATGTTDAADGDTGAQLYEALNFDGTVARVDYAQGASAWVDITVSAWINSPNFADNPVHTIVSKGFFSGGGGATAWQFGILDDGSISFGSYDGASSHGVTSAPGTYSGGEMFVTALYDDANEEWRLYVNGAEDAVSPISDAQGPVSNDQKITAGAIIIDNTSYAQFFKGVLDEVRVSNVVRSADWIKIDYYSQNDPATFLTFSVTEQQGLNSAAKRASVIGLALPFLRPGIIPTGSDLQTSAERMHTNALYAATAGDLTTATGAVAFSSAADLTSGAVSEDITAIGSIVFTDAADINATGTLVATGSITFTDAADINATGTISATGSILFADVADINAAGTVVATGAVVFTSAADLSAATSQDLSATGAIVFSDVADINATASLAATGAVAFTDAADINATGRLDATGTITFADLADINATGTLSATGAVVFSETVDIYGKLEATATGTIVFTSAADLDASGNLTATGAITFTDAADINALANITATGAIVFASAADLSASFANSLIVQGTITFSDSADINATANIAATGAVTFADLADVSATGRLDSTGSIVFSDLADISAAANIAATGTVVFADAADVNATGTLSATGAQVFDSVADINARGALSATGSVAFSDSADVSATASLATTGAIVFADVADVSASGALSSTGSIAFTSAADLTFVLSNSLSATGTISFDATPALKGRGALLATGSLTASDSADINATGRLDATGALVFASSANLRPFEDLSATGALTISGSVELDGAGNVVAVGNITFSVERARLEDGNLGTMSTIAYPGSRSGSLIRGAESDDLEYAVMSTTIQRGARKG